MGLNTIEVFNTVIIDKRKGKTGGYTDILRRGSRRMNIKNKINIY
jgi:hypothetical protein